MQGVVWRIRRLTKTDAAASDIAAMGSVCYLWGMPKPDDATKPPNTLHALLVKGLTTAEVKMLDAILHRRRAELRSSGGTASRNTVIVAILRDAIAKERVRLARMRP